MEAWVYHFPIGEIMIAEEEGAITEISFAQELPKGAERRETPLIKRCQEELEEYFAGRRLTFDLPLAPKGTVFQQSVWRALESIPYGEVRSYGDIARQIGNPKACRAIGGANNRNPIAIVIPCHRVIGADGRLVGYGGGLDKKEMLLSLERQVMEAKTC